VKIISLPVAPRASDKKMVYQVSGSRKGFLRKSHEGFTMKRMRITVGATMMINSVQYESRIRNVPDFNPLESPGGPLSANTATF
jgi:hypothetical protein